jgi:signal transduction histidine kinase
MDHARIMQRARRAAPGGGAGSRGIAEDPRPFEDCRPCSLPSCALHAVENLQRLHLGDDRAERAIVMIRRQTTQVTRMVDDLLDIGRITHGSMELKREAVGLSELIHSNIQAVDPLFVSRRHGLAVVDVVDDGLGISAELLPRIFELYAQDDRTLDRAEGGFGVGLAVVRRGRR